jgi:hypothetical protein
MPTPHLHFPVTEGEVDKAGVFHAVVDRIIDHLKLFFLADKSLPVHLAY